MTEEDPEFIFETDLGPAEAESPRLAWAEAVFADPADPTLPVDLQRFFDGRLAPIERQRALCEDARLRAGSVATLLLADRRGELVALLDELRTTEERARRAAAAARVRLETAQKINATEPNPALRYPDVFIEKLGGDIVRAEREVSRLAASASHAATVGELLTLVGGEGPGGELAMRSFGLAWKGRARLRAWRQARHTVDLPRMPKAATEGAEAFGVPHAVLITLEGGSGVPALVILEEAAAQYCLDLLWLTVDLARSSAADGGSDGWFPTLALPRAIVELCHIVARELPTSRPGLLVDAENPDRMWRLSEDAQEWAPEPDDPSPRRILRVAAEGARIVFESPAVLAAADVLALAQLLAFPEGAAGHRPYLTTGLTEPVATRSGKYAERPIAEATWALVDGLAQLDPNLDAALGGASRASHALWQMALLAHPALPQRTDADRAKLLARLWRTLGRARPVGLLGKSYSAELSRLLSSAGETTPDHPSFYSLAPTVLVPTAIRGEDAHGFPLDLLAQTTIADRLGFVEAVNLTWKFAVEVLDAIQQAETREALAASAAGATDLLAPFAEPLRARLRTGWVASDREEWSLLRGRAPVLWDFWSKVLEGADWQGPLAGAGTEIALSALLRLVGDLVRLLAIVEAWNPSGIERLEASAEPSSQALFDALKRLERLAAETRWPALRTAYEPLYYYFDDTAAFDTWAAFVRGFVAEIDDSRSALEGLPGAERQRELLGALRDRLSSMCATEKVDTGGLTGEPAAPARPTGPLIGVAPPTPMTEQDAGVFYAFYMELIGGAIEDSTTFLKALALLRMGETRRTVHDMARLRGSITQLLTAPAERRALLSDPATPRRLLRLLFDNDGGAGTGLGIDRAREHLAELERGRLAVARAFEGFASMLEDDLAALGTWLASAPPASRLAFALLALGDRLFVLLQDAGVPATGPLDRLRDSVAGRLGEYAGQVEPFALGGGFFSHEAGQLVASGGHPVFDPLFAEPGKPASDALIAHFAAARARALREALAASGISCLIRG